MIEEEEKIILEFKKYLEWVNINNFTDNIDTYITYANMIDETTLKENIINVSRLDNH